MGVAFFRQTFCSFAKKSAGKQTGIGVDCTAARKRQEFVVVEEAGRVAAVGLDKPCHKNALKRTGGRTRLAL